MSSASAHEADETLGARTRLAGEAVAIYGAIHLVGAYLAENASASAVVQAVISEWGAGRMGIHWTSPHAPSPSRSVAQRAGLGAAIGISVATLAVVLALVTGGAQFRSFQVNAITLLVSLVSALAFAVKSELLLHGVVLRLLRGTRLAAPRVLAGALASVAAIALTAGTTPFDMAIAFLWGAVCTALWVKFDGAWEAWGAQAAFLFATTSLYRGGIFDLRASSSVWGGGERGIFGGGAALMVLTACAAAAFFSTVRGDRSVPSDA